MSIRVCLMGGVVGIIVLGAVAKHEAGGQTARTTIATEADSRRAMKELSNWGRWGEQDELGPANLITPAKRKQALALAREGRTVSLAHDVPQEKAVDTPTFLNRTVVTVAPGVALDSYQDTGTYHGVIHSHLDAVDCHIMVDGRGYNGVSMEEIKTASGCPRGSINTVEASRGAWSMAQRHRVRRLPHRRRVLPQGPGCVIHRRRRPERRLTVGAAPRGRAPSAGARGDGDQHLRQP